MVNSHLCLPIDAPFSLISTSLQRAICCHQHHGVIWILHSMNMTVLVINYSRNGPSIAYLIPIKGLICHLYINIFWTVTPFFIASVAKYPTLINSMISRRKKTDSITNALTDTQIGFFILKNQPQLSPPLSLYSVLKNSFGRSLSSTNYSPNKIHQNPHHIM